MKKILTSLLALAILSGCSKQERRDIVSPSDLVPITLDSGVQLTKASIVDGINFTGSVAGWEAAGAVDYTASCSWLTTAVVEASQITAKGVTLGAAQYYSPQQAIKTYMKAWYPQGTIALGKVTFTGSEFKSDGTMDVLVAPQIVGDKVASTGKTLAFTHPLSQVSFKVVADGSMSSTPTLSSITIRNVALPTGLDLTTDALTYAAAADLPIPGITAEAITIGGTAAEAGFPVMFKPFSGNTFVVGVATSESTYADATVTIADDDVFVAGKTYTVTLTFKAKNEITISATVAAWKSGSGSATVE